jgi:D-xylose transport system substrate-binding protein
MVDNETNIEVPFYMEDPIAVYDWNMEETIIRDGFHSAKDVYRTSN